jgi:hypothetical protein
MPGNGETHETDFSGNSWYVDGGRVVWLWKQQPSYGDAYHTNDAHHTDAGNGERGRSGGTVFGKCQLSAVSDGEAVGRHVARRDDEREVGIVG